MESEGLRDRLQYLTSRFPAEWWALRIDVIRLTCPHSIVLFDGSINRRSNCFAYALGLQNDPQFQSFAEREGSHTVVNFEFIQYLLDQRILRPSPAGQLAIYFDRSIAAHAGIRVNNRIRSKWGTGPVFEHDVFELPKECGTRFEYFVLPPATSIGAALSAFRGRAGRVSPN